MTLDPHNRRLTRLVSQLDNSRTLDDPHVQRALDAVRRATPSRVITRLQEEKLLDVMLENMRTRFAGRPLESIPTAELIDIARDSVDESLGIEPLTRQATTIPLPHVSDRHLESRAEQSAEALADEVMHRLDGVLAEWRSGEIAASEATVRAEKILRNERRTDSRN